MKKLCELLGKNEIAGNKVGIEIEAEGENIKMSEVADWRSEDDGSLRGEFPNSRHEFVSGILDIKDVSSAIKALIEDQKEAEFDFSFRTSTHVHVNALDMPLEKLVNYIYLYYLLEKDLFEYCGPSRKNNRFCLRLVDCEYQLSILKSMIENSFRELRFIISDELRYAACNMASLLKYGTLEFRGMRGTMDHDVLMNWVGMLVRLKDMAMSYASPSAIYKEALENPNQFLDKIYGQYRDVFRNPSSYHNITEALSLTIEVPFIAEEWIQENNRRAKAPNVAPAGRAIFNGQGFEHVRVPADLFEAQNLDMPIEMVFNPVQPRR